MLEFRFVDKHEAAKLLAVSWKTVERYRKNPNIGWIEGVHFYQLPNQAFRYNDVLLKDWLSNKHDPMSHQRAIEFYRASLPSNQPKSKRSA